MAFSPTADVELAVRSKVDRAAVVIGRAAQIIELENNRLAARNGDVAIRGETADAIVGRLPGTV